MAGLSGRSETPMPAARKARNPKTNQEVYVPAKNKAVFKVSRELNKMLE
ncbi:HU family DNA-binding protein [Gemmatimonadota bacterium]